MDSYSEIKSPDERSPNRVRFSTRLVTAIETRPRTFANSLCRMKKKHFYTPCVGLSVYMRSSQYTYLCILCQKFEKLLS